MGIIATATVLSGFLAGANIDRSIVQMPAWRRVGVHAWADYSRHADLGNGLFLYPFLGIGCTLLTIASAVAFKADDAAPRSAALPIYLSVALAIGGLLATVKAAPKMLSLRQIGDDPAALLNVFEGFNRWGNVRSIFQVLAFGMNMWSLVTALRSTR